MPERLNVRIPPIAAIAAILFCVLFTGTPAFAQTTADTRSDTATLSGTIVDQTGVAIADVEVIVASTTNGLQRSVHTNGEGAFVIPLLPPGQYVVTAQREGFAAGEITDVVLDANRVSSIRMELKVAAVGENVIVTAQKRGEERLQDVPIPVTVLDAEKLTANGQLLLREYVASIPGVNLALNFNYAQRIFIRGVGAGGATSPTTAVAVDDIPFGGSTGDTAAANLPDFDPGDLARVEVLRGPQGTLYGANSMGGLVNYVTVDPSVHGFGGRIETGVNSVKNGSEPGHNLRASANIPVTDTLAVRASAFTRQDAGYIDNPFLQANGLNKMAVNGGKISAMWQQSPDLSLKASALYQHMDMDGSADVQVAQGLGDLQQNYLAGVGGYDKTMQAYSATLSAKAGSFHVTSATGYSINEHVNTLDRSFQFSSYMLEDYGTVGTKQVYDVDVKKLSQEVRVSTPIRKKLDLLFGGFYTHESSKFSSLLLPVDYATSRVVGPFSDLKSRRRFEEYAAFGTLTWHVVDRFDLQFGVRESWDTLHISRQDLVGPYVRLVLHGVSPLITPPQDAKTDAFNYLVTPRWKLSSHLMLYARFASGYRPGGVNSIDSGAPPYQPDKTRTYEGGMKGDFLKQRLVLDASVYHIDWSNIQVTTRNMTTGTVYNTNGSGARSDGFELSATVRPVTGMTLRGWVAGNDAVLTRDFPVNGPLYGMRGDRMAFASRASSHLAVEQAFPVGRGAIGFAGVTASYVGDRKGEFQATPARQNLPGYTQTDLRAGVTYSSWTANIFVNNVSDKRGLLNGGIGYLPTNAFIYTQPRTIGLSLSRSF